MSKRAVLLASLQSQAPLILFAAKNPITASITAGNYKKHKCTSCSTEVAFAAPTDGVTPFCISCGSTTVPAGDVDAKPQDELLSSVGCPHCKTKNVIEDRTVAAMSGTMHCAACGNGINFAKAADDDGEDDDTEDTDIDVDVDPIEDTDTDTNDTDTETADLKDGDTDGDLVEDAEAIARGVSQGAAAVSQALKQHDAEVNAEVGDDLEVDMTDVAPEDGQVEVKLDDNGEEARLLAFVDGVHTMTLTASDAGENREHLVTSSFHKALEREATRTGFKALASYGFKSVKVNVPIAAIVEKRVQAALADEKSKVVAAQSDLRSNYEQCAKIAAVALTQRYYRNRSNPIADTLVATLQGMGFNQAKQVVARALVTAGPQFVTAMLELADELMEKSVDSRNEISDNLTEMDPETQLNNAITQDPVAEDELVRDPDVLVARLSTGVSPSTRVAVAVETASVASLSEMGAALRKLKRLP